jgi:hypothetical protein
MVRMEDEALSMAEEVACRFVAALQLISSVSLLEALICGRLRSPGQHILGIQGSTARAAYSPNSKV